jgi:multiple sugar transport system substrate-binding protein
MCKAGTSYMSIGSSAGASHQRPSKDAEGNYPFEVGIASIPQVDANNPKVISQGPSLCIFQKDDPQEVLASWLFMQFMLTNEVQIAYAQTEGYLPVTSKAQDSDVYQDYLSRMGEDNDLYYPIKIQASKLLMDNIDRTFVTPVFNGSASVRDAAGQLIENTTKSVRRGENVSGYYYSGLYADVISLYRLDQVASSTKAEDLGPLPAGSVALLCVLGGCWLCIGIYVIVQKIKEKKTEKLRSND